MFSVKGFARKELFLLSRVDAVDARRERIRMVRVSKTHNKVNEN
jgi:hypothetical protein